jgi:hypothetical protein
MSMGELEEQEDGLGTTSRPHYAQSTYYCAHQPTVTFMFVFVNNILLDYLFQETKSYSSTRQFAFIL